MIAARAATSLFAWRLKEIRGNEDIFLSILKTNPYCHAPPVPVPHCRENATRTRRINANRTRRENVPAREPPGPAWYPLPTQ